MSLQIFDDVKLNEDLASFTYEDLKERLIAERHELDAIGLLLQHGAFVVQQVRLDSDLSTIYALLMFVVKFCLQLP